MVTTLQAMPPWISQLEFCVRELLPNIVEVRISLGYFDFLKFSPNFNGKFWLSGKKRELNILFISIWTHQISVLHRSQPGSLMPSHGHFLTLKIS